MNKEKKITPKYYDVKVDANISAILTYRVLASSPEEAVDLIKNQQPVSVKHKLAGKKEFKATVYDSGSSIIRFVKKLINR